MKILFISHKHPPSLGGMENQSYNLVNGLRTKHNVIKLVHDNSESRLLFFIKLKSRVKSIITKNPDIDIIHLNDGLMALVLNWLPAYTNISIVTTFHGLDLIFPSKFFQKKLNNFKRANCYAITVSLSTYQKAIAKGFSPERTIHIDNGVDLNFGEEEPHVDLSEILSSKKITITPEDFILVAVGRAVPRKGFSWFISNVMPELSKTKLLIIGPNNVKGFNRILLNILPKKASVFLATLMGYTTDYHVAQLAIKKNKLSNDVHFLGGIKFNQMVNILRQSNLMIMPNIPFHGDKEGFGLVILEANISGKYVLGANIEGITSAIHDEYNGSLLESKDATEWINTINRLKENKTELHDKGIKAKQYVLENFGWDKMVLEYEKFFQQILS